MTTEAKPQYSPGLAGVIAGETAICWVDPNAGLMYRGYDIHEMGDKATFEEVAYLLLNGELPNRQAIKGIQAADRIRARVPKEVEQMLQLLPKDTHPMDVLRTGVSMLAPFDNDLNDHSHDANIRKSIRLIAKRDDLDHRWVPHFSRTETVAGKTGARARRQTSFTNSTAKSRKTWKTRMMDTIFNLYADHEFNASTFAARVTASTLADIYAAVTSACGTLKGPLHGGANEESMKMLEDIGTPDRAEAWLKKQLAGQSENHGIRSSRLQKGRLPGAGHARDRA